MIITLICIIYGTFLNIKVIKSFGELFIAVYCIFPVFLLSIVVLHMSNTSTLKYLYFRNGMETTNSDFCGDN